VNADLGSVDYWDGAAEGWARQAKPFAGFCAELSRRMVEAIDPQPGQTVLELGAGPGDLGLLAAELLAPAGKVIVSDRSERMLEFARERAAERGVGNVEFKRLDAEWIDLPLASVDGILMRFVLMLVDDPRACLQECRRVLRSGGKLAVAVWAEEGLNPWASVCNGLLRRSGLAPPADPSRPSPFRLGDQSRLAELLEDAGFYLERLEAVELEERHPDFASFWQRRLDLSASTRAALTRLDRGGQERFEQELRGELAPSCSADGSYKLPAVALLAVGEA